MMSHLIFQVSVNPPPVIPLSHGRSQHSAGPDISVPSLWQQSSQPTLRSSTGYTPHHAHYSSERDRWAKLSYAPPPSQTISLEISAVHEGGNRKKGGRGTPFGVCVQLLYRNTTTNTTIFRVSVKAKRISTLKSMPQVSSK